MSSGGQETRPKCPAGVRLDSVRSQRSGEAARAPYWMPAESTQDTFSRRSLALISHFPFHILIEMHAFFRCRADSNYHVTATSSSYSQSGPPQQNQPQIPAPLRTAITTTANTSSQPNHHQEHKMQQQQSQQQQPAPMSVSGKNSAANRRLGSKSLPFSIQLVQR